MYNDCPSSPSVPRFGHADSLIFSITAQKNLSPHETDLLKDSFQNEAVREINIIGNRIDSLENRIRSIKTQKAESLYMQDSQVQNIDISNIQLGESDRKNMRNVQKGMIRPVRKVKPANSSFNVTVRNNYSFSNDSKVSHQTYKSQVSEKEGQIKMYRKEMLRLRMKIQKNERSKSNSAKKLSESKQTLKNLQSIKRANEKLITSLVLDLKKSQNIRKRQKQTIIKQKKEMEDLKKILSGMRNNLRT